jgi:hypothetical protein
MDAEIPTVQSESDDALRRVYGDDATFSRVGAFTLVHLDGPSGDEIAKRVREFDPNEFFFDDCVLCQQAKATGGHIVFDSNLDDEALEGSADVCGDEPEDA